ncbi:MAG: DMT family transporter [Flavobacteriales bacterium]|jgi:drug/metabolite transporter (DMT)-like permease
MGGNQATAGVAWMVLATVLYTAANLCVKALAHLPTEELVFLRSVISLVLTGGWLWWKGYALFGVNRKWLLIRGIFGTIGLATFFHTLRFIPIASATVIQYLSPIFTVLLARYFDGQRSMKPLQWVFFGTAFAGVLMVKGFDPRINWLYFSLGVISAMAAAVAYLATMKCRETDHPVGVVIWFHLVAVPVTGSWTAFTWVAPVGHEWLLALAVGLLSVVAQIAMTYALHQGEANVIMPFKYFGAVLAFVFGLMLFDERLNPWAMAGIAIVIASVTINTLMKRRWERAASRP